MRVSGQVSTATYVPIRVVLQALSTRSGSVTRMCGALAGTRSGSASAMTGAIDDLKECSVAPRSHIITSHPTVGLLAEEPQPNQMGLLTAQVIDAGDLAEEDRGQNATHII